MEESLHYLLMTDYLLFQKAFLAGVKETNLTPGQPKILDYLLYHDGVVQKEIASACHIEPATMTSVLYGMEKKGYILRKNLNGNRRSIYIYLTDEGRSLAKQVESTFRTMEEKTLKDFCKEEKEMLTAFLMRISKNIQGDVNDE